MLNAVYVAFTLKHDTLIYQQNRIIYARLY